MHLSEAGFIISSTRRHLCQLRSHSSATQVRLSPTVFGVGLEPVTFQLNVTECSWLTHCRNLYSICRLSFVCVRLQANCCQGELCQGVAKTDMKADLCIIQGPVRWSVGSGANKDAENTIKKLLGTRTFFLHEVHDTTCTVWSRPITRKSEQHPWLGLQSLYCFCRLNNMIGRSCHVCLLHLIICISPQVNCNLLSSLCLQRSQDIVKQTQDIADAGILSQNKPLGRAQRIGEHLWRQWTDYIVGRDPFSDSPSSPVL